MVHNNSLHHLPSRWPTRAGADGDHAAHPADCRGSSRPLALRPPHAALRRGQRAHRQRAGRTSVDSRVDPQRRRHRRAGGPDPGGGAGRLVGPARAREGAAPGDRGRPRGRACRCVLAGPVHDRGLLRPRGRGRGSAPASRYVGHLDQRDAARAWSASAGVRRGDARWDEPYGLVAAEAHGLRHPRRGLRPRRAARGRRRRRGRRARRPGDVAALAAAVRGRGPARPRGVRADARSRELLASSGWSTPTSALYRWLSSGRGDAA